MSASTEASLDLWIWVAPPKFQFSEKILLILKDKMSKVHLIIPQRTLQITVVLTVIITVVVIVVVLD